MTVVVPRQAITAIAKANDPAKEIRNQVGDLGDLAVLADYVLVGTYIRPEKIGSILRPDSNIEEDLYQGKVGLVLKLGPDAFQDTSDYKFNGVIPELGDWVVYKVGDAWSLKVRDLPCRLVRDVNIRLIVDDPLIVF